MVSPNIITLNFKIKKTLKIGFNIAIAAFTNSGLLLETRRNS